MITVASNFEKKRHLFFFGWMDKQKSDLINGEF